MTEPKNQHQTTEAGPPRRSGVLRVVATELATPIIENAKLIVCRNHQQAATIVYVTTYGEIGEF